MMAITSNQSWTLHSHLSGKVPRLRLFVLHQEAWYQMWVREDHVVYFVARVE